MAERVLAGSCLCGVVAFEVEGPPVELLRCHCRMCQKAHGGPYATFARFAKDAITFTQGADSVCVYRSSGRAQRTFCGQCGSALQFIRDEATTFGLAVAVIDGPIALETVREIHSDTRVAW